MNQIDNTQNAIETIDGQLVLDGMPEPIEQIEEALTIETIVDQILESMKVTESSSETLYFLHKVVNAVLTVLDAKKWDDKKGALVDYRVTSQMVYNYSRNGMVVKGRKLSGDDRVNGLEMRTFAIKFCRKFMSN